MNFKKQEYWNENHKENIMKFEIGYYTELDTMYVNELKSINTSKEREIFLKSGMIGWMIRLKT